MRYREVARKLTVLGCIELPRSGGGSHRKWHNPTTRRSTVVPDWGGRDLKLGTIRAAVRQLGIDWSAFYWLPADIFGPGKVLVFGEVRARDGSPYPSDMRTRLREYTSQLYEKDGTTAYASNEVEGFLFKGRDAERQYFQTGRFEFISTGGYYHSLPGDALRMFIDRAAEAQRAMGFANEEAADYVFNAPRFSKDYTPAALRRSGVR